MEDIVNEILEKTTTEQEKYKPVIVEKHLDVELDLGTLLAIDKNDLDPKLLNSSPAKYLLDLTRDNTQILLNAIWDLPTERVEEIIVAKLPPPKTILPRAKCVPKPKVLTKWEKFAKEKGIQKKKKSKLSWDEQLKKWVPTFGYKKVAAQREKEWVIEVPQNADPNIDMFTKTTSDKQERVAKNELQRLRNIAKQKGVKVPRMGITSSDKLDSRQLATANTIARASTASLGKFQPRLPKEKDVKSKGVAEMTPGVGKKRKAPPNSLATEKKKNLETVTAILNKRPALDIEKAVNKQLYQEQIERSEEKSQGKSNTKKKGKKRNKGASKPAGGKGKRNPNKRVLGRKRR